MTTILYLVAGLSSVTSPKSWMQSSRLWRYHLNLFVKNTASRFPLWRRYIRADPLSSLIGIHPTVRPYGKPTTTLLRRMDVRVIFNGSRYRGLVSLR